MVGVTRSDMATGFVTVNWLPPDTELRVAVMIALPREVVLAMTGELKMTTPGGDELQAADWVKSWVVPSVYVPVAKNV